ncbi:GTP 3',8-cyclase MoaA [Saccharophagus degradans]|uniref:GTP 3',8-cyclase n=1 Tax=Saccharophagus degradans (strain 2-40 / ATCC 43961 / DSM 17024) TaxID=203122 RepID=MOAA_SACD2|nr:GTP 3',8-cyclase MoaA [Saccharophagus degradans]Q21I62.1 RecName: Full=GTP 3',8-cyclase; AltName: Full=Molybdenum cofactor biosynthesis protein A [Saccharophagus degradans 2-40]ABD81617.1 GTP cyclohydrolase subunit MoaA [Saccharophagus degradans 2-40]
MQNSTLIDSFGRQVTYVRLSVTDRCDFRCIYCMAEDMTFLPRKDVLSLEEFALLGRAFAELGVTKIRVSGGEPLIRKDVIQLFESLGAINSINDLCLTSNGSKLTELAKPLVDAGVHRINVSLDTLNEQRFKELTRFGDLNTVLKGIDAALNAGFKKIKLNSVVMKNYNLQEAADLATYALERGMDISFIEEMPLGEIHSHSRDVEFISSDELRNQLSNSFELTATNEHTGGPSRYWKARDYNAKIGFISPHSHNFCDTCNRVRVTASGRLLLCLGNEHSVDLRAILRAHPGEIEPIKEALINAMAIKPEKHEFNLEEEPQILRFMNMTGG